MKGLIVKVTKLAVAATLLVALVGLPAVSASAHDSMSSNSHSEGAKIGAKDRKAIDRTKAHKLTLQEKIAFLTAKSDYKQAMAAYQVALAAWQVANASQVEAANGINATYATAERAAKDAFNAAVRAANDAFKVAANAASTSADPAAAKKTARTARDAAIAAAATTRNSAFAAAKASRDAALTALGNAPIPPSKPVNDGKGKVKRNR
jgi:trimeric autotransporter adhesin